MLVVKKSPTYWDRANVKLSGVRFYPIEIMDTEERAFRAGQLHVTYEAPYARIDWYRQHRPDLIHIDPFLGTDFYRLNHTRPPLNDKRVRRALALALDRLTVATKIAAGGEEPAYCFTPPNTAGYTYRIQSLTIRRVRASCWRRLDIRMVRVFRN